MTWNMVKTWIHHGLVTTAFGLLGLIAGGSMWAVACALVYVSREEDQHRRSGTHGFLEWLDRIVDAATPIAVAMGFALWM